MLCASSGTVLDLSFSPSHRDIHLRSHFISKSIEMSLVKTFKGQSSARSALCFREVKGNLEASAGIATATGFGVIQVAEEVLNAARQVLGK